MSFLLYGCNGYTGNLLTKFALERGIRPVIAGRNHDKVQALAQELDLEYLCFDLDNPEKIDAALQNFDVVAHCAGPFSRTSRPMIDACLRTKTHYLDVTGEIEVFEAAAQRDAEAKAANIMVMPGVGFDVVPSDCMALYVKQKLPGATHLKLGICGVGGISHGTAITMVENMHRGGLIRKDGKLTKVPPAWKVTKIDFGRGPKEASTAPWGDVSTAFYSTGIPNIEVYMTIPPAMRRFSKIARPFGWLLGSSLVQNALKNRIKKMPQGPNDAQRAKGKAFVWAEAKDNENNTARALLSGPEGYTFTVLTALSILDRVQQGNAPIGFQTPAKAYGADLVMEIPGVDRKDLT